MRAASTALLKAAEDFWRTLPPGSRVAISRAQTDILPERYEAVRCEWNLRAVFPGQTPPPSPWTTYDFAPPPDERPYICVQDEWNPTCPHFGG